MLSRLPEHSEVERSLAQAHSVLGCDPRSLDAEETLRSTAAVQLCLLIAGVAMARVLIAETGEPDMVAGMSVGAYPAAVIAGALDFGDAMRLVALRGRLMQEAFPAGYGMTAVIGLAVERIERIVADVHTPSHPVFVANLNGDSQIIVAGHEEAMAEVAVLARDQGASRCERLSVTIPSHCELLASVACQLKSAMADVPVRVPRMLYLSSSVARAVSDPSRVADELSGNVARRVNWRDTAMLARQRGAGLAVEMPSGDVLTGLTEAAFADGIAIACEGTRLDTLCALIQAEKGRG